MSLNFETLLFFFLIGIGVSLLILEAPASVWASHIGAEYFEDDDELKEGPRRSELLYEYDISFSLAAGEDCYSNNYPTGVNYAEDIQTSEVLTAYEVSSSTGTCESMIFEWDLETTEDWVAGKITVLNVTLIPYIDHVHHGSIQNCLVQSMEHRETFYRDPPQNATALGEDIINGTRFLNNSTNFCNISAPADFTIDDDDAYLINLFANATADLQDNIDNSEGWWAVAVTFWDFPDRPVGFGNRMDVHYETLYRTQLYFLYSAPPEPVDDLIVTSFDHNSVDLDWTTPIFYGYQQNGDDYWEFEGYQINRSAAGGGSPVIIVEETTTFQSSYTVEGLDQNTEYDFRVSAITQNEKNASGNIVNVNTLFFFDIVNFTNVNFNVTNTDTLNIFFTETEINSTVTTLDIDRPEFYNLACSVSYRFQATTDNFTSMPTTALNPSTDRSTLTFVNHDNEVIHIFCWDQNGVDEARYLISQTSFPLIDNINLFRDGTFGTKGDLGAFDLVGLGIVVVSMLALNRFNESVGVVVSVFIIGALWWFEMVSFPSVILSGLVVAIMVAIISTRKKG